MIALPIGLVTGEVLALQIKAKQAESARLEPETEISVVAVEDGS